MKTQNLPIELYRDEILSSLESNSVTIISAETGAGKSTKVPQYLLNAGYEVIVTQPRRLAARTLAERVAEENGTKLGEVIGYKTAQDQKWSENTKCLFVTDGLQLVNELMGRAISRSRVLILDEVHEWNLNIEVLVAWVRRQVQEYGDFKVILMSATLESDRLSEYFFGAPVIQVPGRLFPITKREKGESVVSDAISLAQDGRNVLVFQPGKNEIEETISELKKYQDMFEVLPLHGELSPEDQKKCFQHYHCPKIVVSTNVAQTSVTIDDIDAVVDSGLERRLELIDGIEGLYIRSISVSDSEQRAGRSGRTRPGIYIDHSPMNDPQNREYRERFPKAEIERVRLDQTVLRLAEVGFDMEKLEFFHQPDPDSILKAKSELRSLGCMDEAGKVTSIGRRVSRLPVSVSIGRMLIEAEKRGVLDDVITVAAIMEVGQLHARKVDGEENRIWRLHILKESDSDPIAQLNLFGAAENMTKEQMYNAGIHIGAYHRIKQTRKNISDAVRRFVKNRSEENEERIFQKDEVIKSVCAGLINNIYVRSFGNRYKKPSEIFSRDLSRDSVIRMGSELVVGIPFDLEITSRGEKRTLRMIRMVSKIDVEVLKEIAPQLISVEKGVDPRYSFVEHEVVADTVFKINGITISTTQEILLDHPQKEELHIDYLHKRWLDEGLRLRFYQLGGVADIPPIRKVEIGWTLKTREPVYRYATYAFSGDSGLCISYRTLEECEEQHRKLTEYLVTNGYVSGRKTIANDHARLFIASSKPTTTLQDKLNELKLKFAK